MTQDKIDLFLITKAKYFKPEHLHILRSKLEQADDSKAQAIMMVEFKDPTLMLILSVIVGTLGIDRFVVGDIGIGVLKLLTGGLCGVLAIIDWFLICGISKQKNFELIMSVL